LAVLEGLEYEFAVSTKIPRLDKGRALTYKNEIETGDSDKELYYFFDSKTENISKKYYYGKRGYA
jgi:hypothetical protein